MTDKTNQAKKHGGYLIYDLTVEFCRTYLTDRSNLSHRTIDQMIQAARSGRQNIAEGYEDFLRQRGLNPWGKDSPEARKVRGLCYKTDTTYQTYRSYLRSAEEAANAAICLIHQANYLLDRQLESLKKAFVETQNTREIKNKL